MPQDPVDAASRPARSTRAGRWLLVVAAAYLVALWWLDRDKHILHQLASLRLPLALATLPVLLSFALRYQRWRRLLHSQGDLIPWWPGALAYLSGFAFTASPGKAGELLRIRYYARMQVPASRTLAAFLFERALDLVVVTALGAGAASLVPAFGWLAGIVGAAVALLLVAATWDGSRRFLHGHL
ncbi:flippase-like domain-containing protein, partial [Xanthomonas sp. Kuri4-1]